MTIMRRTLATKIHDGGACVGTSFVSGLKMTVYQCGTCGVHHGLTEQFIAARRRDHADFYCPWCQTSLHYSGESDEERTRRLLADERSRSGRLTAELDQTRASLSATKGVVTRVKKQRDRLHEFVGAGQCPVPGCHRHLKDLARHMQSKHADWVPED